MLASVQFRLKTRHLVILLLLSTVSLIQSAQSIPLSSQSLLKAPKATNPSDSNAGSTSTFTTASTSNQSIEPNWSAWSVQVSSTPVQQAGCFVDTYPSTVWQPTNCVTAPLIPLQPSPATVGGAGSATVGNGDDEVAQAPSGTLIGSSIGSFQVSGLASETDSMYGANNYGLQINSQTFTTSTTYTGGKSTTGWEQFVWINWPHTNSVGYEYIQYWLLGYQSKYGSCPTTGPPGGSSWMAYSTTDCYANSPGASTPLEAATNLASLSLKGFSNYNHAATDVNMFCISGSCYDVTVTDQIVNLYQNWQYSEFNVFGVGSGSQANFNSGTTITVTNTLKDQSGNVIVPSCVNTGYTGETNNLNSVSCSSNSNGQIVFIETSATLNVALVSPPNGGTVSSSPVTFQVQVTDSTGVPIQGAQGGITVTHLSQFFACAVSGSDSNGYFSCNFTFTDGGTYSWYATASKTGYGSATSQTWTFTYYVIVTTTMTTTQTSTSYSYRTATTTSTSYTSTAISTSTIPTVTTVVLVPLTITSTVQSTQFLTPVVTTTTTSYTSTTISMSTIPTTVALVPLTVTSIVHSIQYLASILSTTTTSYTSTTISTSTIPTTTTVVLVPLTATSTVGSTQLLNSTATTTMTSYTSTVALTSTVPTVTTVVLLPTTTTSTVQSTQFLDSTVTTTTTSYTTTVTSNSTRVVYTTVTVSKGAAGVAGSIPLTCLSFLSLLTITVGHKVIDSRPKKTPKIRPAILPPTQLNRTVSFESAH